MARLNDFMGHSEMAPIYDYCCAHGEAVKYDKGRPFVNEGSVDRYIAIVQSGYFKYVVFDDHGDECTTGFSFEGDIVTDYVRSFLFSQPSLTSIIAGADAEVLRVPIAEMRKYLENAHPDYLAGTTALLLNEAYRRYIDMHRFSPTQRYLKLIERAPGLLNLVPMQELASYLSVSRRQFQRIRRLTGHLSHDK